LHSLTAWVARQTSGTRAPALVGAGARLQHESSIWHGAEPGWVWSGSGATEHFQDGAVSLPESRSVPDADVIRTETPIQAT